MTPSTWRQVRSLHSCKTSCLFFRGENRLKSIGGSHIKSQPDSGSGGLHSCSTSCLVLGIVLTWRRMGLTPVLSRLVEARGYVLSKSRGGSDAL